MYFLCDIDAAKRAELEEQKRNLLQQQAQVRELEMEQIVEQGQLDSFCDIEVGDNLVKKIEIARYISHFGGSQCSYRHPGQPRAWGRKIVSRAR